MIEKKNNNKVNRAVFLDRDGVINISDVINGKPYAPKELDHFILYDDVVDSVKRLKQAGFLVIVVTNQPDVGNGKVKRDTVESMHVLLVQSLPLDKINVCYHSQTDGCECRKPKPGMILNSAEEFNIDLSASYIVGDRKSDIEAGEAAGCKTIFIERNYLEPAPVKPDIACKSLTHAVNYILEKNISS